MKSLGIMLPALLSLPLAAGALVSPRPTDPSPEDCDVRREFQRELDAAEVTGVMIEAESGSLDVIGADIDRIRVQAVLCASDEGMAADSRLVVERRRDAAWIESDLPDGSWRGDYARMDLRVEMPREMAADIQDGSGEVVVTGIAALRLDDGSGGVYIEDVAGAVRVDDGSGELNIRGVGTLEVDDGSGSMDITDVRGDVVIEEDGSGSIDIRDVAGSVTIDEDGSGSITVVGVGGDFVLRDDGSGSVRYRDVEGRVSIPPER